MKRVSGEMQYLQNAADIVGLTVHEHLTQDKRRTVKRYFAQRGNETVSPSMTYERLNDFLLGWINAERHAGPRGGV